MKVKFIAFDIDGVIFSSENFLQESYFNGILEYVKNNSSLRLAPPEKNKILKLVGKTYKEILGSLFPELNDLQKQELRKYVIKDLTDKIRNKRGQLLNGVIPLLKYLKKHKILTGTASNGSSEYVKNVLQTYDLIKYFNEIVYVSEDKFKEKTDILIYYKNKYNLNNNEIMMVGDRFVDYVAAQKAKTIFVGIKGHGHDDELVNSDYIFNDLVEFLNFLQKNIN